MSSATRPQRRPIQRDTSRDAFHGFDPTTTDGKIIAFIARHHGATVAEIVAGVPLPHQTASAQVTHLHERGEIHATDERRATPSGRKAIVWSLGPKPRDTLVLTPEPTIREQLNLLDVPTSRPAGRSAYGL